MIDYDGFPVDVVEGRCGCVDITGQRLLEVGEPGHGCHLRHTGAWPKPDWNLDQGHKVVTDEELQRIKDSFPKHRP